MASELALLLGQELCNLAFLTGIQVYKASTNAQRMMNLLQSGETYLYAGLEGSRPWH
jgi:hypothetical protein